MSLLAAIFAHVFVVAVYKVTVFRFASGQQGTTVGDTFLVVCLPSHFTPDNCAGIALGTLENEEVLVIMESKGFAFTERKSFLLQRLKATMTALPKKYRSTEDGFFGVVLLEGDRGFVVTVLNLSNLYSADTLVSLPIDGWGKKYFIITYTGNPILSVLSAYQNTTVQFDMKDNTGVEKRFVPPIYEYDFQVMGKHVKGGKSFNVTLPKYKSFQIHLCKGNFTVEVTDLTGSVLTSNKPIGVIVGCCLCGSIPGMNCETLEDDVIPGGKDAVMEMLMPAETYGKEFIVFGAPRRKVFDSFRMVAVQINTTVRLYTDDTKNIQVVLAKPGDWDQISVPPAPALVTSNKPISLFYVMESSCITDRDENKDIGDPSLCVVVPTVLFFDLYTWTTPLSLDGSELANSLILIVLGSHKIVFDDQPIPEDAIKFGTLAHGHKDYRQLDSYVPHGTHNVYELSANKFGMYVYGASDALSFVNPGGYIAGSINAKCKPTIDTMEVGDLNDNDCDGLIDEEKKNEIDDDNDGRIDEDLATPPRADGKWSAWQAWVCNPVCGASGKRSRIRECDDPPPTNGGLDCEGKNQENSTTTCKPKFKICPKDCPEGFYGYDCLSQCPANCSGDCNKEKGFCLECNPGLLLGDLKICNEDCPAFFFGQDCGFNCSCHGDDCIDKVTGECPPYVPTTVPVPKADHGEDSTSYILPLFGACLMAACCLPLILFRKQQVEKAEEGEGLRG